jgi:hypothetical protein
MSTKGAKIIPPTRDLKMGLAFGMAVFLGKATDEFSGPIVGTGHALIIAQQRQDL